MKRKKHIILTIIFVNIIIYSCLFAYVYLDKEKRVNTLLKAQIDNLKVHYNITTNYFKITAENALEVIHSDATILGILEAFLTASPKEQNLLREDLYQKLEHYYKKIQNYGVLQFHFVSPKSITLLRMHKPTKYNDDLSDLKYSFRYTNRTQKPIRGLERGETSVSFRDVRPIYSKSGVYLGCVDVAFTPEKLRQNLLESSGIYSNLIFHESVIQKTQWSRNNSKITYRTSVEHDAYYEYTQDEHSESFPKKVIKHHKNEIARKIQEKAEFALYEKVAGNFYIVAFLPMYNIKEELIGYLVSYNYSKELALLYFDFYIINLLIIAIMLLLSYFAYRAIASKREIEREKDRFHRLSLYDTLTNLPNRLLLQERLDKAIVEADRNHTRFAILFIDLDNFKNINDSFGHKTGDEMLRIVANKMSEIIDKKDTLARLGGDEFLLMVDELDGYDNSTLIASQIIELLKKPIFLKNHTHYIGASIGISIFPDDATKSLDLLKYADLAMYKAKENGKGDFVFYARYMSKVMMQRVDLENELREAIKNEEFIVYFQPQIDAKADKLLGMEALVRWQHPTKGLIPPYHFIPFAEESGLIEEIDRLVMQMATKTFCGWYKEGLNPGVLSLNLCVKQMDKEGYLKTLVEILTINQCEYRWLELEITESQLMKNPESAITILQRLSSLGITLSIDDFGTGYSSLSYLKRLPIDKLKIDKSFIQELPEDEEDSVISKAIISLAKSLNLKVIAEGVETKAQKDFLVAYGCSHIQGYYYSKPIPADEIKKAFL